MGTNSSFWNPKVHLFRVQLATETDGQTNFNSNGSKEEQREKLLMWAHLRTLFPSPRPIHFKQTSLCSALSAQNLSSDQTTITQRDGCNKQAKQRKKKFGRLNFDFGLKQQHSKARFRNPSSYLPKEFYLWIGW